VRGEVKMTVVPPWERVLLYPGKDAGMPLNYSPVDFIRPDPKKHENFKSATPFDITLRQGDCIYLPAYWWHQMETSADASTIIVTYWYRVAVEWVRLLFEGLEQRLI
jgi:jumonji domain-containing protein 7